LAQIVSEINANPATFLRCSAFSRSVHPDQQDLARRYYSELIKKPFFVQNILPKIHDVPMGDPYLCDFFPFASPMTIQHVYYLNLMKEQFGIFIPREKISHIVEIGGGYGNFCRLVKNFGYKGKYMIADLPSMLEIQKHYLSHALQNVDYFNNINFGYLDIKKLLPSKKATSLF